MKRRPTLTSVVIALAFLTLLLTSSHGGQAANPQTTPLAVVINEVAWSGTAASPADEWIELYNNTDLDIDLTDWTLVAADGTPNIALVGVISAHSYFLLERTNDSTISDILADQIYTGILGNSGEQLELRDDTNTLIDTADGSGGWPGGSSSPQFYSMERKMPTASDAPSNWNSNDGLTRNGLDANGSPLNGTPKARNSAFVPPGADLGVDKSGLATVVQGEIITYTIALSNAGQLPAQATRLTDVLPAQVEFLAQTAPYPFSQPVSGTLVWDVGIVPTTTAAVPITLTVTGQVDDAAWGELINVVTVTSATTESNPASNHDTVVTIAGTEPVTPAILIEALYYDGYELGETDEAVRVMNVSTVTADIGEWALTDGTSTATFPLGTPLLAGQAIWCAKQATAFERQFGFKPDFETGDTDAVVPEMDGTWPGFANDGDECVLQDAQGRTVDALVYRDGNTQIDGWSGSAVEPWSPNANGFPAAGQILYRKREQATGLPVPDTDTAADWAQDPNDHIDGRKVLYPGWDLDAFFFTRHVTETATLTVAVAPDNLFETIAPLLARAQESIQIESYSFRSKELADVLLAQLDNGVSETLLLEGSPAVEGVTDEEKWIADQLSDNGAQILFMINDTPDHVYDRYRNQHAKLIIVDGETVLIGSENLNHTSMPADDKTNGTAGRRGVYLITDSPGVVARAQAILEADADPAHHLDVAGCDEVPDLCTPPAGFVPAATPNWITYTVQFTRPLSVAAEMAFELIHSPENSLRSQDSLLGLLNRAGPGDTVLVEQFYEYTHWGPSSGTPQTDPNSRLEAYLGAARRGATVRILLDAHFDDGGDNAATVAYLRAMAGAEGWDLQARLGDPTYLGLHNKMVLAHIGGQGYVHVGSINGSEVSSKVNREVALQVQSNEAYGYLKAVFDYDWSTATPPIYLPLVFRDYTPPHPADHLLISEVYYKVSKGKEWAEILNPTAEAVDLSLYKIGDAEVMGKFEGMYRFPGGAIINPNQVLVVAARASDFRQETGRDPDFEIYDSDPDVPTLVPYGLWGTGEWELRNLGDEILLLDGHDQPIDVVVYGDGSYPGVVPHPGVELYTHSLERYPPWLDTDDCSTDFRDSAFPSPGELP